jgi:hypothetical protein
VCVCVRARLLHTDNLIVQQSRAREGSNNQPKQADQMAAADKANRGLGGANTVCVHHVVSTVSAYMAFDVDRHREVHRFAAISTPMRCDHAT